jgi:hypothetical protein
VLFPAMATSISVPLRMKVISRVKPLIGNELIIDRLCVDKTLVTLFGVLLARRNEKKRRISIERGISDGRNVESG